MAPCLIKKSFWIAKDIVDIRPANVNDTKYVACYELWKSMLSNENHKLQVLFENLRQMNSLKHYKKYKKY